MTCTVNVVADGKTVVISNLTVSNPDFAAVIAGQAKPNREQTTLDVIAVGSAAMRRVQTTVDVDFVEKRFGVLCAAFERALASFEKQALESLSKRFSPTEPGSYTKHIADLVGSARKDVQGWTTELAKSSKDLLDPDKKSSAVGRLEELITEASEQFEQMFDPEVKGSYTSRLNEQLASLFGEEGRPGALGNSLRDALQPVLKEIQELKEKIEARKAAEQVIAASTLKGRPFEELVHARLSQFAQPFGDDVLAVGNGNGGSKAGDFLVMLNGSGKSFVVEARDRKQMSLPAIKGELDRERAERDADLAIYVSSGPDMLPQHVGDFQIYEDKLITTVDNLHIAYRMARLVAMSQAPTGEIDIPGLRGVLTKLKDAASSLRNVKTKASQIRKLTDGIQTDADGTEEKLLALLEEAEEFLVEKGHA
jgi:hypothetical protein